MTLPQGPPLFIFIPVFTCRSFSVTLAFIECIQVIKVCHCPYLPAGVAGGIANSCKRQEATGLTEIEILKFSQLPEFLLYI